MQIRCRGPAPASAGSIGRLTGSQKARPATTRCRSSAVCQHGCLPRSTALVGAARPMAPLVLRLPIKSTQSSSRALVVTAQAQARSPSPNSPIVCNQTGRRSHPVTMNASTKRMARTKAHAGPAVHLAVPPEMQPSMHATNSAV